MADEFDDRDLKSTLNAWRKSADEEAERDDWFWSRQRAQIVSRMNQPKVRRIPTLAWAGIAATVAVGVALIVPGQKVTNPKSPVAVTSGNSDQTSAEMTDHELMQQLQETMNQNVPDALQPGSNLQQVMENRQSGKTVSKAKEITQ